MNSNQRIEFKTMPATTKKNLAALKRIEKEEYGYCLACSEEINIKPLQYNPTAEYRIACTEAQEI